MSDERSQKVLPVLHVHSSARERGSDGGGSAMITSRIGFRAAPSPDVYRALARLGHDVQGDIRAAIVCVDELLPPEFEFFSLVSRLRPDVKVYVYGRRRARRGIEEALTRGATAELSDRILDDFAGHDAALHSDNRAPPEGLGSAVIEKAGHEPNFEPEPMREAITSPLESPAGTVGDEDPLDEDERVEEEVGQSDGDSAGAARVPWMRYAGGPIRTRPSPSQADKTPLEACRFEEVDDDGEPLADAAHDPSTSMRPAEPRRPPSSRRPYEPLLTDEELRALIGDNGPSPAPQGSGQQHRRESNGGERA